MVYEGLCGEISIFFESQTDRQNRLLNPASHMRARGNETLSLELYSLDLVQSD